MFKDWKRAVLKAPLHFLLSVPFAIATLPLPFVGGAYVTWRAKAEADDESSGRDTHEKSVVDLWSQTALVRGVLRVWGRR